MNHPRLTGRLGTLLLMAGAGLAGGCGYSAQRPFPDGIQTVYVEMFQSREFRRDLEFQLTEALAKRIEMDTPYRIADRQVADTILTGEVLEVQQRGLGNSFETARPREIAATIILRYAWKDQRTGELLVDRPRFAFTTTYIPDVGQTFERGMIRGLDRAAERMVETMETGW